MTSGELPLAAYHRASHVGSGSFGSVLTVYDNEGDEYALKLFSRTNDEDDEEDSPASLLELGALREISILRLLRGSNSHPNIIALHDVQTEFAEEDEGAGTTGLLGMAMPLFPAGTVADALATASRRAKVQMAHGLLCAVEFLHANGILHRDIKSANVLLRYSDDVDGTCTAVLCDFSLAKPIEAHMWSTSTTKAEENKKKGQMQSTLPSLESVQHTGGVGTVVYTAPEIWSDEPYSYPSDVYSTGIVLLELLRGSLLMAEKNKQSLAEVQDAISDIDVSKPFGMLVQECLQVDPTVRPTATGALRHQLFSKFGLEPPLAQKRVHIPTAIPYDDDGEVEKKHRQRRLKAVNKVFHSQLNVSCQHPWTRLAALEYSQQFEQMDAVEDGSQAMIDCCILAYRLFELEVLDLAELDEQLPSWCLDEYIDNEATLFMLLDHCLYPRNLTEP